MESSDKTSTTYIPRTLSLPSILYDEGIHSLFYTRQDSITYTLKVFLFSSALLALAAADSCSDCTAVVSTIGAYLSSEESIANQQVGFPLVLVAVMALRKLVMPTIIVSAVDFIMWEESNQV